jgi:hypothetical protein
MMDVVPDRVIEMTGAGGAAIALVKVIVPLVLN